MSKLGEQRLKIHPPQPVPFEVDRVPSGLNPKVYEYIDAIANRYESRASLILPMLMKAQQLHGWISEVLMMDIADYLNLSASEVLAVASFYSMFNRKPAGRYLVQICRTLPCALNGAETLISHFKQKYNVKNGDTTADGKFTLIEVECLAACSDGPCVQINTEYYERVDSVQKLDEILDALK